MRSIALLCTLISLVSCQSSPEVTAGSSTKSINQEAPYIWKNKTFPKTIRIDSSFSASEKTNIAEMSTAWKTAVTNQVTFFTYGAETNNAYDLDSPDGVMGIYKAVIWPADVSDDALAITQLFGRRYNVGDHNEYVGIEHADILVNYKPGPFAFDFDSLDNAIDEGFDLRTIMLHEMGHFLGLQHVPYYADRPDADSGLTRDQYKATSVMYPSINDSETKRVPQTKDINTLIDKYRIDAGGAHIIARAAVYEPRNNDPGKSTKIMIELRKNGECLHKENGAIFRRHFVQLKK